MKNTLKILSLLSLFAISACSGNKPEPKPTPTYEGDTPTPTPSVSPTPTSSEDLTSWTEEELAAIEEYAYGVDLPVVDFRGEARLEYVEDYYGLCLDVSDVTDGELEEYALKYLDTDFSGGYDSEDDSYTFLAPVELNDGSVRFVASYFYISYEEGANYGDFSLYVYDPFYYSFDELSEDVLDYLLYVLDSEATIPEFTAQYYYADTTFLSWGFPYLDVVGYGVEESVVTEFEEGLIVAEYTLLEEVDEDGYSVAISPDGLLQISYFYFEEEDARLFDVYFEPYENNEMPEEFVPMMEVMEFIVDKLGLDVAPQYDEDDEDIYVELEVEAESVQEVLDPVYAALITDGGMDEFEGEYVLYNDIGIYSFSFGDYYEFDLFVQPDIMIEFYASEDDGAFYLIIDAYFGEMEQTEGEGTVTENDGIYTANIDFTSMSDQAVFTSQTVGEATFTANNPTGNDQKDAKYYANGSTLRVYAETSMTFSVSEGYEITEVKVTLADDDKSLAFSVLQWENGTAEAEGLVCTVTPTDGSQSVSFQVTGTKGHLRITDISVSYKVAE